METLRLIKNDPWLEPFADAINGRHQHAIDKEKELTGGGKKTLADFATGHLYFGLHQTKDGWIFREWAPNATQIFLIGDFNEWKELKKYALKRKAGGNWEIKLPADAMKHGDLYKLKIYWEGGCGERIPAWATRVVQDEQTKIFSAQVWAPAKPYKMKKRAFKPNTDPLLIYECHVGMAQDAEKVGTYREFQENVLPRVAADGYNCIQVMAIQEQLWLVRLPRIEFLRPFLALRHARRAERADRHGAQDGHRRHHGHRPLARGEERSGGPGQLCGRPQPVLLPRRPPRTPGMGFALLRLRQERGAALPAVQLQVLVGGVPLRRLPLRRRHFHALL